MPDYDKLFIGGQWVAPAGGSVIEVHSPATLELVGTVPEAVEADVDAAVDAARRALESGPWPATPPGERAQVLPRLSQLINERGDAIAQLITSEMGAPPATVSMMQQFPA